MKQNWNKESLLAAYPRFEAQPDFYLGRTADAEKGFADTFGKEAERFFSAPGRTEIGGNHTDHQHGCVLAAAVDLDIFGAAAKNGSRIIRIFSEGYGMEEISLDDLEVKKEEINTTASLIRGVASKITQMGYALGGLDMYTVSNVLKGSGISSSAAYEVLVGTVINALYCENKLTPVEIAQIGQYAENVYFGKMTSGKTTVALHMVAEVQKRGGIAGFIDAEHALDPVYAKSIGVDIDNLYISQPDNGEQALEITETMVRSGAVDIVIVDSVAALVPKAEIEGDMGDSHVGLQARLMSQALRKLTAVISKSNCVVIFINQLREKVGVMFGNPETTTGGRALKFYASVRMDVRRVETLKQGGEMVGNHTRVKVVKNKVAPPFKQAEFDIMFGTGISREGDILDLAAECSIVNKSGAWYAYEGDKIGQGRENAKLFLREHPEIRDEIEKKVRVHYHLDPADETAEAAVQAEDTEKEE